jgi:pilus assembly protein FimV
MDDDIEDTEDPTITAATAVDEDDASEAITSVDDVDDAAADFDPDAIVEAEAAAEPAPAPAPAPDQDSAKAFVDITGADEDESATGDHTVAHAPGGTDDGGLDFDITMGEEDLSDGLDITGVDDGEDEGLEITMGTPEETPADGEMSLQGAELDELALDAGSDLNAEDEEFDFSLEGTAEMDGIAVDDTLDMASVASDDAGELEIGEDASLDDLAMELDAVIDDPSGGELDLDIEAIVEDEDDGHLKTVALDADLGTDLDDDGEKTVVMPMSDDVGRQSDTDEADTKLNLAKAYIELGDTEAARSILDEVASDGNDEQKAEAKALLGQIPG